MNRRQLVVSLGHWTALTALLLMPLRVAHGDLISMGPKGIDVVNAAGNRALTLPAGAGGAVLDGTDVPLGQVESGRPSKRPPDNLNFIHPDVVPEAVFRVNAPAPAATATSQFDAISDHSENVAGVMISTGVRDAMATGVAPLAKLYSSADTGPVTPDQIAILTSQHVAAQTFGGRQVQAINYSYGKHLAQNVILDGTSQLSMFIDWSARTKNALHVIAGNETSADPFIPVPSDSYNGLIVGSTTYDPFEDEYNTVSDFNRFEQDAHGARRSIDIVAPGEDIEMPSFNDDGDNLIGEATDIGTTTSSGTSFAAPHVTGTAALLYQYSNALIPNPAFPRFGFNSGRHEVIKAVLMNSAEKIEGVLGSNKTVFTTAEQQAFGEDFTDTAPLNGTWEPHEPWDDANGNGIWDQYVGEIWWDFGGDKTPNTGDAGEGNGTQDFGEVFSDSNGNGSWDNGAVIYDADGDGAAGAGGTTWLQSDAFAEPGGFVPKDVQMGTGQLNAARAITQFEPGEWHGSNVVAPAVPKIGWDLGGTTGFGDIQKYALDPLLFTDDWISITLAWDRFVSLNDVGADGLPGTGDAGEGNGDFDLGDTFSSAGLTDLDLFLVPVGGTIINAVAASRSLVDSVEHIFYKFKPGEFGNFEIWVRQAGATAGGGGAQPYGLAWWTVPEPSGLAVALVLAAPLTQAARRRRSA